MTTCLYQVQQKLLDDNQGISKSLLDYYILPKLSAEGGAFSCETPMSELSVEEIFETLKKYPELLNHCDFPPDAKSLSKREYVKWKAQAHI